MKRDLEVFQKTEVLPFFYSIMSGKEESWLGGVGIKILAVEESKVI
jgi:hypothetical protein